MASWSAGRARSTSARETFSVLYREAVDRGDEHSLPFVLFPLARFEFLTGDWTAALEHAREGEEASLRNGQIGERPFSLAMSSIVEAHLGNVERARAKIAEGLQLAERIGDHRPRSSCSRPAASSSSHSGDAAGRRAHARRSRRAGSRDRVSSSRRCSASRATPSRPRSRSATATRRSASSPSSSSAAAARAAWPLAIAARGRGLLRSAQGEPEAAIAALAEALALHDRVGEPFERARTLLVLGTVQRRERKKRPARESLEAALEIFHGAGRDALGGAHARRARPRRGTRDCDAG